MKQIADTIEKTILMGDSVVAIWAMEELVHASISISDLFSYIKSNSIGVNKTDPKQNFRRIT